MKSLNLFEAATITASTTVNATAVDMTTQNEPFTPGNTAVVAIILRAAANVTVNVQKSDDGGSNYTTVASSGAITTAETRTIFESCQIGQLMRVQTVGIASGAGTVDIALLNN
jgi:hypothetical protein